MKWHSVGCVHQVQQNGTTFSPACRGPDGRDGVRRKPQEQRLAQVLHIGLVPPDQARGRNSVRKCQSQEADNLPVLPSSRSPATWATAFEKARRSAHSPAAQQRSAPQSATCSRTRCTAQTAASPAVAPASRYPEARPRMRRSIDRKCKDAVSKDRSAACTIKPLRVAIIFFK